MLGFAEKSKAVQAVNFGKTSVPAAPERQIEPASNGNVAFGFNFSKIQIHPVTSGTIQTKLTVNTPGDQYEREADSVSEQVMRMAAPGASIVPAGGASGLQRKCACGGTCEECRHGHDDDGHVQRKSAGPGNLSQESAPSTVHEVLRSAGQPLDFATRAFMEPRFGHDFSAVRVHADGPAGESARDVSAHAYTVGNNVVFGAGRFTPGTDEGRRLIAHELTHVVQQNGRREAIQRSPATDAARKHDERAAHDRAIYLANRIKNHGKLSVEVRAAIDKDLAVFEGSAKDVYIGVIKPALRAVLPAPEIEMEAESARPAPAPDPVKTSGNLPVAQAPPGRDPRNNLAFMLVVWKAQGLLDSPVRPKNVAPIPPFPVTRAQAAQLRADLAGLAVAPVVAGTVQMGGAAAGTAGAPIAQGAIGETTFASGTGTFPAVDVAGTAAVEEAPAVVVDAAGTAAADAAPGAIVRTGAGATVAAVAVAAAILLYDSAPADMMWEDAISQVTSRPFTSAAERGWEIGLTQDQVPYIKELWERRFTPPPPPVRLPPPQPALPAPPTDATPGKGKRKATDKTPVPQTRTDPDEDKRRRRKKCKGPEEPPCGLALPILWPDIMPIPEGGDLRRTPGGDVNFPPAARTDVQRRFQQEINQARRDHSEIPKPCFEHDNDWNAPYDAHHIQPLYLNGEEDYENVCALRADLHQRAHPQLDNQSAMVGGDPVWIACRECRGSLRSHPAGQEYVIEESPFRR